ncbi:MAG TPA: MOSC domain-containing protein, partial [Candidatus Acidoferrum sp.]
QPRLPCYKLGIRFESDAMVRKFLASAKTGFYLAVTREGDVGAGDAIQEISRDPNRVSIAEIVRLYVAKKYLDSDKELLRRTIGIDSFPEGWKEHFRERASL